MKDFITMSVGVTVAVGALTLGWFGGYNYAQQSAPAFTSFAVSNDRLAASYDRLRGSLDLVVDACGGNPMPNDKRFRADLVER